MYTFCPLGSSACHCSELRVGCFLGGLKCTGTLVATLNWGTFDLATL